MAYSNALAALADPTRRAIYESLRGAARAVGEIAAGFPVSRPAVSQHLRVLREAGLVSESRLGTRRLYAANPAAALELRDYFQSMWQCAMQSYARHVTTEEQRHASKVGTRDPGREADEERGSTPNRVAPGGRHATKRTAQSGQGGKRGR